MGLREKGVLGSDRKSELSQTFFHQFHEKEQRILTDCPAPSPSCTDLLKDRVEDSRDEDESQGEKELGVVGPLDDAAVQAKVVFPCMVLVIPHC